MDSSFYHVGSSFQNVTFGPVGSDGAPGAPGLNGTNGLPGAPGANGQTSYVHFAYANSADGTVNFTTGAAGGRYYVGTYTDFAPADSASPGAYTWSVFRGADGANGTPGAPGANGQATYVHIAYANSSNGVTGFSTTDGAGKTYIGTYTDQTLADSNDPAAYTWSLIKGADGADGVDGADGRDGISAESTGAVAVSVPCDSNGTILPGGLAQATGTMRLRHALTGVLSGATGFTTVNLYNCAATINATTGVYTVTDLTGETGSATFTCMYGGNAFSLTISLSKARRGKDATSQADTGSAYTGAGLVKVSDVELVIPAGATATISGGFDYQTTPLPSTYIGQIKITAVDVTLSGAETDLIVQPGTGSQAFLVESPDEPGTYEPRYQGGSARTSITYTNSTGAAHYYRFSLYTGASYINNANVGSPTANIGASY